jgi:hypothetical protein
MLFTNGSITELERLEVFDYYDVPILFTCIDGYGQIYLVVMLSYGDQEEEWLYIKVSRERLAAMKAGEMDIYTAFREQEQGGVCIEAHKYTGQHSTIIVNCDEVPDEWLPEKGDYLVSEE